MHCVPVFPDGSDLIFFVKTLGDASHFETEELKPVLHVLTHRDLYLHTVVVKGVTAERPTESGEWMAPEQWDSIGLPAPIRKLLDTTQAQLW